MKCLGIMMLVLSGYVMAGEIYQCSDYAATGFTGRDGQYRHTNFTKETFKMKIQDDRNISIVYSDLKYPQRYICFTPYNGNSVAEDLNILSTKPCVHENQNGYYFNFNVDNGKYILFRGSGYVSNVNSVSTRIGNCTKFNP